MRNSKRNWAKFGVAVKLIVILRHIIAYFSINIRWHSQNVSYDSRKWLIKHLFPPSSCKNQINKQNSYLLLAFFQSGSVPELDMYESKPFLPGQFVHSENVLHKQFWTDIKENWRKKWKNLPSSGVVLLFSGVHKMLLMTKVSHPEILHQNIQNCQYFDCLFTHYVVMSYFYLYII